jgi:hypothetical protein
MKPFAFIVASAFVLAAIHAYATPTYGGPQGARAGFDLNSIQVSIAPFRLAGGGAGMSAGTGSAIWVTATTLILDVIVILWVAI